MRRTTIKTLAASLSIIASAALAAAPAARAQDPAPSARPADLLVTFSGLQSSDGALMVALFDSEAAYGGQGAPVRATAAAATAPTVRIHFEGLAPGRYAIKAFHDVNGDGKLNLNPFGVPTEPYAFSNGAVAHMGPPPWSETVFTVGPGANTQSITIQ